MYYAYANQPLAYVLECDSTCVCVSVMYVHYLLRVYVCMYNVCVCVCLYVCMHVRIMYVCVFVCMHVCMYA